MSAAVTASLTSVGQQHLMTNPRELPSTVLADVANADDGDLHRLTFERINLIGSSFIGRVLR
jgi:hypothetical protein